VKRLWKHGLAKATRVNYRRNMRRYSNWANKHGIEGDGIDGKPTEVDLIYYLACEVKRGLAPGSVKGSLTAIVNGTIANGFSNPMLDDNGIPLPTLHRVVRGISRRYTKARKERRPLTTDKLAAILKFAEQVTQSPFNATMMKAALSLGVYLLLRVSEFVHPTMKAKHNKKKHMSLRDVTFLPNFEHATMMDVRIRASKTDPYRNGQTLRAIANGSATCPVRLMKEWIKVRGRKNPKQPLFAMQGGKNLTRAKLQQWMRAALDKAGYEGMRHSMHSLRKGGAESLAAAGFDTSVIMVLGRWKSSAHLLYTKMSDRMKQDASKALGNLQRQDLLQFERRGRNKQSAAWL
jgi:site-specific recombinase XerD